MELAVTFAASPIPFEDRFWRHVDKSGGADACWLWTGPVNRKGYGYVRVGAKSSRGAHRVAWALVRGPIPEGPGYHGTCVCHHCDSPPCCNPDHLFLGTVQDNLRDMATKGRGRGGSLAGERNPNCKLTTAQVVEVRTRLAAGEASASVALAFAMTPGAIRCIGLGDRRRDAPGPRAVRPDSPAGERNPHSKLTAVQVMEIRVRLAAGESQSSIARAFGVVHTAISKIATGRAWREPAPPPSLRFNLAIEQFVAGTGAPTLLRAVRGAR